MIQNRVSTYTPARRLPPPPAEPAAEWQQAARRQATELTGRLEAFLTENPKACLGIGLALGVFLGWLIKRR